MNPAESGELSPEESAVVKAILIAMAFAGFAILVIILEMVVQGPIVIYAVLITGVSVLSLRERKIQ
jgi:hypothetical protein